MSFNIARLGLGSLGVNFVEFVNSIFCVEELLAAKLWGRRAGLVLIELMGIRIYQLLGVT